MATLDSLAKEYSQYILLNEENPSAASEIIRRINGITYTGTGKKLTKSDKEKLVNKIQREILPEKKAPDGFSIALEAEDSSQLITLIQMIRSGTAGK